MKDYTTRCKQYGLDERLYHTSYCSSIVTQPVYQAIPSGKLCTFALPYASVVYMYRSVDYLVESVCHLVTIAMLYIYLSHRSIEIEIISSYTLFLDMPDAEHGDEEISE